MEYHQALVTPADPSQASSVLLEYGYRGCCGCTPPNGSMRLHTQTVNGTATKRGFAGLEDDSTRYRKMVMTRTNVSSSSSSTGSPTSDYYSWSFTEGEQSASATRILYHDRDNTVVTTDLTGSGTYEAENGYRQVLYWSPEPGVESSYTLTFTSNYKIENIQTGPEFFDGYTSATSPTVRSDWVRVRTWRYTGDVPPGLEDSIEETSGSDWGGAGGLFFNPQVDDIVSNTYAERVTVASDTTVTYTYTLSDEYTDAQLDTLVEDDLAFPFPDLYLPQTAYSTGFTIRLFRHNYADETSYTNAIASRVSSLEGQIVSVQASLSAKEVERTTLETDRDVAEQELADLEQELEDSIVDANGIRTTLSILRQELSDARHRYEYDSSLTEAERTALLTTANNLQTQVGTETASFNSEVSTGNNLRQSIIDKQQEISYLNWNVAVVEGEIVAYEFDLVQLNLRLSAAQSNLDYVYRQRILGGSTGTALHIRHINGRQVEKQSLRYRWVGEGVVWWGITDTLPSRLEWREFTLPWNEIITPDNSSSDVVEEVVSIEPYSYDSATEWRTIPPPEDDNTQVRVHGMPERMERVLRLPNRGGMRAKNGHLSFDPVPAGGQPRVYLRQTWGGGFPGCPIDDRPSKTYSGVRSYETNGIPASDNTPLSADLVAALAEGGWPGSGAVTPLYGSNNTLMQYPTGRVPVPAIQTSTYKEYIRGDSCDGNAIQDILTATLSNEHTTAMMKAAADDAYENGTTLPRAAVYTYFQGLMRDPIVAAVRYTSPDEMMYWRGGAYMRVGLISLSSSMDYDYTADVDVTVRRLDLDTGVITEEGRTYSVTILENESTSYLADIDLDPSENELVWVEAGGVQPVWHPTRFSSDPLIERAG